MTQTNSLQRLLEISGITLFFGLTVLTLLRLGILILDNEIPYLTALLFLAILTSMLFADFASGLVHWAADNWGTEEWPILGKGFILPFRMHHVDPQDICHHGFVELNGNNCIVSLVTFWMGYQAQNATPAASFFWQTFWLGAAYWVLGTNQFHAFAHHPNPPKFVRLLQKLHLILPKEHHALHHRYPHNQHYCITTGWLNKPLEMLGFFKTLEKLITFCSGVLPKHKQTLDELRVE